MDGMQVHLEVHHVPSDQLDLFVKNQVVVHLLVLLDTTPWQDGLNATLVQSDMSVQIIMHYLC